MKINSLYPVITTDKLEITKEIVLSSKKSYGNKGTFKYFIGYINSDEYVPLYIKLLQMIAIVKYFDYNKYMNLLFHDKEILKKNLIVTQCIMIYT